MKATTCLGMRRLSTLVILFLLFITVLTAQVKIKEKVEIAPRASINASVQTSDLLPGFSCTVPYSGPGVLWIYGFDNIFEGRAKLTMNGQTIVEDIYNQIFILRNTRIDLGYHGQGEVLTFELVNPSSGNIIMPAQECDSSVDVCAAGYNVIFTYIPICGQGNIDWGSEYPTNVEVGIGFANAEEQAKRILQPAWEGSILFKDPTLLRADYKSVCTGGLIDLPEGTTFTFTITQGQEHAILYDIYSGNEGTSLSGIPANVCAGWVRLKAIGDEPSQPVNVTIEAKTTVPGANSCVFHITIPPNDLKIIPTKSVITYGDTLRFDVWKKLSETTYGPLESGMEYRYSLVEGYEAGYLTSPDGSQASEYEIGGDFSSSIFTAYENTPQGKSTLVKLKAMAYVPEPPPSPCPDCTASIIKSNNPLPVTNGPMLNRSASKINTIPQLNKTNSIEIEKNVSTSPTGIKNKTGAYKVPLGIEKPRPESLHKNADGSYSFVNRDSTGARVSSKNINKIVKQQADNSSQIVLRKNAYGGYSPEKINPITSKTGTNVTSVQYESSDGILSGIVTVEVVKPSDILLGETKYYTAKPDPDQYSNLIITESYSPDLGDGDERVIFEDPQIADDAVNNDTIGVHWDYLKPDITKLDNGVIRLIGKRWKPDTTYKVKLHAVLRELGREGAVEIEVKPGCIHAAFAKTPLSIGDTTTLQFVYTETNQPVPLDKLMDVSIMSADGTNGCLLSSSDTLNVTLNHVTQPVRYIAPDSIRGDSLVVNILAVPSAPTASYGSSGSGQSAPQINANIKIENTAVNSIKGPKGSIIKPQALSHATLKALQEGTCETKAGAVKKPKLEIVTHSPWTLWPYLPDEDGGASRGGNLPGYKPMRTFKIQVLDENKNPVKYKKVKIETSFTSQTGGHQHTNGTIELPPGPKQGWFYGPGQAKMNPLILTTDIRGVADVELFIASEFSGQYLVTASLLSDASIKDTVNLQVKVPGLINFRNHTGFELLWTVAQKVPEIGANHPSPYWLLPEVCDSLFAAACEWNAWCITKRYNNIAKLSFNDMSLEWGGAFECLGDWVAGDYHSRHRVGCSVDINGSTTFRKTDWSFTRLGTQLNIIMNKNGGKYCKEETVHYGFKRQN